MTDYNNSHKNREELNAPKPKIQKVVSGEVIIQKKGLGWKFKDMLFRSDFRNVFTFIFEDILIPAAKSMFVESAHRGAERMVFGESRWRGGYSYPPSHAARTTYTPYSNLRDPRLPPDPISRVVNSREVSPRSSHRDEAVYILSSKDDADRVLEAMSEILDTYPFVSVAELKNMTGRESETNFMDQKYGWSHLMGTQVRQINEGWLLELPPIQEIN